MKKIIYCKYNQNRAPKYQTKTVIYQTETEKYIEKEALCQEADAHIEAFQMNYELVKDIYPAIEFINCEMQDGVVRYPFITGTSIDDFLKGHVTSWEELFVEMKLLIEKLYRVNTEKSCGFKMTEEFKKRFGDTDCSKDVCVCPCNLDMIFDNLMIMEDGTVKAFDYEWVCDFPVPEKYVIYRVLCRFYDKYFGYISPKYSFEEYIEQFQFDKEEQERYRRMEDAFIQFIYKGGEPAFQAEQYFLKRTTFDEMAIMKNDYNHVVQDYNNALEVLHKTESDYLTTIDRLNEAVKIKEDVENVLHDTEQKYLTTIDRLNEAVKIKEDVETLLHKTESEYLTTINRLNEAVKIKEEVETLLHKTEEEYLATIDRLNETVRVKNEFEQALRNTETERDSLRSQVDSLNNQNIILNMQLNMIVNSSSWKITRPLRGIKKVGRSLKNDGVKATFHKVEQRLGRTTQNEFAEEVNVADTVDVAQNATEQNTVAEPERNRFLPYVEVTEEVLQQQRNHKFEKEPKISIITPLFNTPEAFMVELLESVKNQTYGNWELCLVNFSDSAFEAVDSICRRYAGEDARFVYHIEKENKGISENTNTCIAHSTGDYIALLDHDDVLHPCALYEAVKAINETGCDFLYTDEIKFEGNLENLFLPNFKPDFSIDELRAHNFICHFNVYKKSLYDEVGGYRKEFDGSQDHDIVLRLTEKAEKIVHIPKILYYWRVHANSVAQNIEAKSYATDAGEHAVTEQLERAGEPDQYAESVINHIPLYRIHTKAKLKPDVTVLIWGDDGEESIEKTKNSLRDLADCECKIVSEDGKTLGAMWNTAMAQVHTKYALFIKAGLELPDEDVVNEFMIYADREDIATIDCKVLTDQNTIFSGGAYLSGDAGMPIKLRCMGGPRDYAGYENGMFHSRAVAASTGLCTFVDAECWRESEGFPDMGSMCVMMEYSYDMWKKGKRNIWTPFIEAYGLNEKDQKYYIDSLTWLVGKVYDDRDSYLSKQVIDLKLE